MSKPIERKGVPLYGLNFRVEFQEITIGDRTSTPGDSVVLCGGSFSELSGIEATMEPKVIKEGGRNFGDVQRAGPVTLSTVILKRGVTKVQDAWIWFQLVAGGSYAKRLTATVTMLDEQREPAHVFVLHRALAVKFKAAELNATASAVAVEELHIACEGLEIRPPTSGGGAMAGDPGSPGEPGTAVA